MNKEWFKKWFSSEDYLNVYQHRNDEDAEKVIDLILNEININNNSLVLDAACGAGRHSILFAKKGFKVTGFDLSETLLNIAKVEANKFDFKITFYKSDIRNFFIDTKFHLIVNLFTSFGYFYSDEENFAFIKNAFKMLNKGGYFVLDYFNKEFLIENLVTESQKKINGSTFIEHREISGNRVIKKIQIKKKSVIDEYIESVKLYDKDEILNKFNDIGFSVYKIFGNYDGEKFDAKNSQRLIIIFLK